MRTKYPGTPDRDLRNLLLDVQLEERSSQGLSEWLEELGVDARGTVEQKRSRIREHTTFLGAPSREMIAETLENFQTSDARLVAALCESLGCGGPGHKQQQLRRLHLTMAIREEILPPPPSTVQAPTPQELFPFLEWYPVYRLKNTDRERDLYADFFEIMGGVYGYDLVHQQVAVAHGASLKIDFHIGSTAPGQHGIGIEFKMPATNSDVQRAIGQLGQYQSRYGQSLILVVFDYFLEPKHLQPFFHELQTRGIAYLVKSTWG